LNDFREHWQTNNEANGKLELQKKGDKNSLNFCYILCLNLSESGNSTSKKRGRNEKTQHDFLTC